MPEPFNDFCNQVIEDYKIFNELERSMAEKIHINEFHSMVCFATKRRFLCKIISRSVQIDQQFNVHLDRIWSLLEGKPTLDELNTISQNLSKLPLQTDLKEPLVKKINEIENWRNEALKFLTSKEIKDKSEDHRIDLINKGKSLVSGDNYLSALEQYKYLIPQANTIYKSVNQPQNIAVNQQSYNFSI